MENNIEEIMSKFSEDVIKNIDVDNINKIISYLKTINCNIIDDIITDYFDIFTIEYDTFVKKLKKLNNKYNGNFFKYAEEDLNYLEEFFKED